MLQAVLVDDSPESRENLRADLAAVCPQVEILGEADSVVNGAKLIRQVQPSLVFLDIQLGDGSGFDILEILGEIKFNLIFTTASDAYAVKAFRYSAIDYLLKPIDPEELKAAVEKVSGRGHTPKESLGVLLEHIRQPKPQRRITLHTLDKIHVVNINDIVRCEADVNYTRFFFSNGTALLVTKTLKEYEELLKEHQFLRVHQSHLVNSGYIREFVKADGGYLVMNDRSQVPVSTRKRHSVLEALNSL